MDGLDQRLRVCIPQGSLVHMLGFPMGLVNNSSRMPICRLGCIARISEAQIKETHNLIVDIQNFPGNSGSPIITRPEFVAIEGTKTFNKSILLGIVHAYIPYSEQLINGQTKQVVEIRTENSGLALVHPHQHPLGADLYLSTHARQYQSSQSPTHVLRNMPR